MANGFSGARLDDDVSRAPNGAHQTPVEQDLATRSASGGVAASLLPYLDAAYNLARWLMRNEHDAQDIVQEAFVRVMRSADTFRGTGAKTWLLTIVRNAAFDRLRHEKGRAFEELDNDSAAAGDGGEYNPQAILMRAANAERVRGAIQSLPPGLREVVVLREMEGLSYREIAGVIASPIGTVMSRLARGRERLAELLSDLADSEGTATRPADLPPKA